MKKALVIPLTDKESQEVYRILIDRDKNAALEFLNEHARVVAEGDGRWLNGDD